MIEVEDTGDDPLPATIAASNKSSVSSRVDNSKHINTPMPYIWFNAIIAALSLGLSIGLIIFVLFAYDRSSVSENHWRNIEVQLNTLENEVHRAKSQ